MPATTADALRTRPILSRRGLSPSIREVCLLGPGRTVTGFAPGSRIQLHGRRYEVAADGPTGAEGVPPRYLHLHPAPVVTQRPR